MRTPLHCEQCGVAFWRKRSARDALRFCSKRCSGQFKSLAALSRAQHPDAIAARAITQEIRKAERRAVLEANRRHRARLKAKRTVCRTPSAKRTKMASHICPDCGGYFVGTIGRVYCSQTCMKRYKPTKYPPLQDIESVAERNILASMVALVKQARRTLNDMGISDGGWMDGRISGDG